MNSNFKRPAAGSLTGKVWDIADSLSGTAFVSRATIIEACTEVGINKATAATQYAKWVKARQSGEAPSVQTPGIPYERPSVTPTVGDRVNAIAVIEARGYEVQYIGQGLYRVQPARNGQWPSYYKREELAVLAALSKPEMREMIAAEQKPNPWAVNVEEATSDEDEAFVPPFTQDDILIQTEDYLRANGGLGAGRGLDPKTFLEGEAGIARYNMGRYCTALVASVERRGAQKGVGANNSVAYYPAN